MNTTISGQGAGVVLGVSGGMDSSVLLHMAVQRFDIIHAVFFDYSQRHFVEKQSALKQIEHAKSKLVRSELVTHVIDVKFIKQLAATSSLTNPTIPTPNVKEMMGEAQPKSYVPNRNMIFLSILASLAEAHKIHTIWHGSALADSLAGYWDSSDEFRQKINELLGLNRATVLNVETPLIKMSKKDIILRGLDVGVNFANTYTCYSGEIPCDAESASSSLRIKGFIDAGYIDPICYKQDLSRVWQRHGCKPI